MGVSHGTHGGGAARSQQGEEAGVASEAGRAMVGLLLVACGVVLLAWPAATTRVLAVAFGVGGVVYGIGELSRLYLDRAEALDLWSGLIGIASIFAGAVVVVTSLVAPPAVAVVLGASWVVLGLLELAVGLVMGWSQALRVPVGIISIAAGLTVALASPVGPVLLVWLGGLWLVLVGIVVAVGGWLTARRPAGASG
jgi:uncharacterized membrane protein HdeD (DUF308 family)